MKVSFDFDGTLSEDFVQVIAKSMMDSGHDVWVITSRNEGHNWNIDLFETCLSIKLPLQKVIFTNGQLKQGEYARGGFELHFDNDWEEVSVINENGGHAILINPDFIEIYSEMNYRRNEL
jgi:hypothetical protein